MTREEMIRRLVTYSVEEALREPNAYWLHELFEKGFSGYRRFSSSKLKQELELRGLNTVDEEYGDEDADDYVPEELSASITAIAGDGHRIE
jgi:hypothetical protein